METHLRRSEIDGLVLPASVTEHLGIQGIVAEIFAPEFVLPGPGQGIAGRPRPRERRTRPANCWRRCIRTTRRWNWRPSTPSTGACCRDQDLPVGALARVSADGIAILGGTGAARSGSRSTAP